MIFCHIVRSSFTLAYSHSYPIPLVSVLCLTMVQRRAVRSPNRAAGVCGVSGGGPPGVVLQRRGREGLSEKCGFRSRFSDAWSPTDHFCEISRGPRKTRAKVYWRKSNSGGGDGGYAGNARRSTFAGPVKMVLATSAELAAAVAETGAKAIDDGVGGEGRTARTMRGDGVRSIHGASTATATAPSAVLDTAVLTPSASRPRFGPVPPLASDPPGHGELQGVAPWDSVSAPTGPP